MADLQWRPSLIVDESTGDSDKTLTVPNGVTWRLLSLWVQYTSTTTVGNRQLDVHLRTPADVVVGEIRPGLVQAASATRYYYIAPSMPDLTSARDTDYASTPLPENIMLPEGFTVRIFDNGAIAADSDDMLVRLLVEQRGEHRNLSSTAN